MTDEIQVFTTNLASEESGQNALGVVQDPLQLLDDQIEQLRKRKRKAISDARDKAYYSWFEHEGKRFACDSTSRQKITESICMVNVAPKQLTEQSGWKAMDKTFLSMPHVEDWNAFFVSLHKKNIAVFNKSEYLKQIVNVTGSLEEIAAVDWDATPTPFDEPPAD